MGAGTETVTGTASGTTTQIETDRKKDTKAGKRTSTGTDTRTETGTLIITGMKKWKIGFRCITVVEQGYGQTSVVEPGAGVPVVKNLEARFRQGEARNSIVTVAFWKMLPSYKK